MGGRGSRSSHSRCLRCGKQTFHNQKRSCSSCAYPLASARKYKWSTKAIRRRTTGNGCHRYLIKTKTSIKKEPNKTNMRFYGLLTKMVLQLNVDIKIARKIDIYSNSIGDPALERFRMIYSIERIAQRDEIRETLFKVIYCLNYIIGMIYCLINLYLIRCYIV